MVVLMAEKKVAKKAEKRVAMKAEESKKETCRSLSVYIYCGTCKNWSPQY